MEYADIEEDVELNIMLRAQEQGLSPKHAQAIYRMSFTKDPISIFTFCIEGMGYDDTRQEKPGLCSGMQCLEDDAEYVQFRKDDNMFIMQVQSQRVESLARIGGITGLIGGDMKMIKVYYAGNEEYLDEIELYHEQVMCPRTGQGCRLSGASIYRVADVRKPFIRNIIGRKDFVKYSNIITKEVEKAMKAYQEEAGR